MSDPFMPIDLKQINTGQVGANTKRAGSSSDVTGNPSEPRSANNVAPQDSVELSDKSQLISSLLSDLSTKPEVNESKVERLRNSIASGEYSVSADKLASKLLTLDFGHRNIS
ncbi:MAG: negative regulator of flagellin synthesis FlgM [Enterobacterales bacterium]|jgi:negative regulator of flagellin synthesis FlgM